MRSVLVANRGEIAVRIIRTARAMGLRTVAIYSELDRDALHVRLADEAWNVGGAAPAESYLNAARILSVAAEAGADAVHPGYGFLSENAGFAAAVLASGLRWVGPSPEAIAVMGDKIASRRAAMAAGAPTVPGTVDPLSDPDEVRAVAAEFGYPVAIKAAHGGGGRGLRVVHTPAEVDDAFEAARREAAAYFGNPEVYVEKYIDRPRHIEAQILVDDHGNELFLGERDCSVQRRHQKLIEETPSSSLPATVREQMGAAALSVARACGYRSAGTVEFLLDGDDRFYFLEMNTRLQVEHTVTEMVTGIDLVREQLRIAAGEPVSVTRPVFRGHAIQCRINAEDPFTGFSPHPGQVTEYREPNGFGVRVDGWVGPGTTVSPYYDNLLAKLVVWGENRREAIGRAVSALSEYVVRGVPTTIPAHLHILSHPDFLADAHHTDWLEKEVTIPGPAPATGEALPAEEELIRRNLTVEVGGRRFDVAFWAPEIPPVAGPTVRRAPRRLPRPSVPVSSDGIVTAPMQGTILKVLVKAGDRVEDDTTICILEAMKMENEVRSPGAGEVVDLRVRPGDTVAPGDVIAVVR